MNMEIKARNLIAAGWHDGRAYWDALQYIGRWTRENHAVIHDALLRRLGQRALVQIGNEHNFVWRRGDTFLHGKGATPAWRDACGRPLLARREKRASHKAARGDSTAEVDGAFG